MWASYTRAHGHWVLDKWTPRCLITKMKGQTTLRVRKITHKGLCKVKEGPYIQIRGATGWGGRSGRKRGDTGFTEEAAFQICLRGWWEVSNHFVSEQAYWQKTYKDWTEFPYTSPSPSPITDTIRQSQLRCLQMSNTVMTRVSLAFRMSPLSAPGTHLGHHGDMAPLVWEFPNFPCLW